jgi:pimeloyl-ACP methyl ester carboxylesterase
METLSQLFEWAARYESGLSGIAASVAIVGVVITIASRASGWIPSRQRGTLQATPVRDLEQQVRYTTTPDGISLAWASVGKGTPLVRALGWFTNIETEWSHAAGRQYWERLAQRHRLIRYDGRGIGLSQRGVMEFTSESRLTDLEAVVDAAGLDRFALMGASEGGATAIAYAARHPERVTHLVVYGSFLQGGPWSEEDRMRWAALRKLIPKGWGHDTPAFRQLFTSVFLPDGTAEQNRYFNEMQRFSASPETAADFLLSLSKIDAREAAAQVRCPTLVMHRVGDLAVPFERGREIAAAIPGARLLSVPGNNHWMTMVEAGTDAEIRAIEEFLDA